MANNVESFIENSFLAPLFAIPYVTDISYNGVELFYVSNTHGRQKAETTVKKEEVGDFLRQIANLTENQFSFSSPILDVSFGRYRLNAVYQNLVREENEKTYSFSLRLENPKCSLLENPSFFPSHSEEELLSLLEKGESIIIGGQTGTGKTELEKWLLLHMKDNSRVIVIDNVEELDMFHREGLDLTMWLVNETVKGAGFASLIKNALRNNPDYIVVAEARGAEMLSALNSAMSGHPIITSVHAQDVYSMPDRLARLAMLSGDNLRKDELMDDIANHLRYYVYLEKSVNSDGSIARNLTKIARLDPENRKMTLLFGKGDD